MIRKADEDLGPLSLIVVDIGNTTVALARWVDGGVVNVTRVASGVRGPLADALDALRGKCENKQRQAIVMASVVSSETEWLAGHIEDELDLRPFVVGDNTPLPLEVVSAARAAVGVDRVCAAGAAYDRIGQRCVVVDAGSAVTIDVVDDEGVFCGGAILPGLRLQAKALAEGTARLPLVDSVAPGSVIGNDTDSAIRSGLFYGMAGAIRGIVEQIATESNHWPQVVLTGGDGRLLKDHLDFVDDWVPDLCLMGIGLAYMQRINQLRGSQ